ncbi:SWI/SNF chromatin remodeling complex component [Tirmania nivea]|nr:SWI/SNF chromatin remodeling complex component [Tirmania nivea]
MSAATSIRAPSPSTAATTPLETGPILNPQNAPEDKKWLRLQFLLKQSKVYSSILADKMKAQQAAQRAKEEKEREKLKKEQELSSKETKEEGVKDEASSKRATRSGKVEPAATAPKKRGAKGVAKGKKGAAAQITLTNFLTPSAIGDTTTSTTEALAAAADEGSGEKLGQQNQLRSARQPKLVTGGNMKPYQLEGLDWLCSLYENGLNGILADEMGLGKTLQTIAFLAFLREKGSFGPFLVIAPVNTLTNWVAEIERFTPDMPCVLYHGTPQERESIRSKRLKKVGPDFPIVCTSYELIMKDRKYLQRYSWAFIIIDEGHRIKNLNCKLIKELKTYTSANRLLLTGTPLQNNLAELWSLLNFLLPDIFDDLDVFQEWFDFSALREKEGLGQILEADRKTQIVQSLHAILKPFLLRRVKADVMTQLPPKREYVLYAPLTKEQKELYQALVDGKGKEWLIAKLMSVKQEQEKLAQPTPAKKRKRTLTFAHGDTPSKDLPPKKKPSLSPPAGQEPQAAATSSTVLPISPLPPRKRTRTSYYELSEDEWLDHLDDETLYLPSPSVPPPDPTSDSYQSQLHLATKEISSKKLQNLIMQLRLCCNSPHQFYWPWSPPDTTPPDTSLVTSSGKLLLLDRLLPELFTRGHKVLIFSQFATTLDILYEYAYTLRGWKCARIDGSVKLEERREQIDSFNENPDWKVFLLSTRAGGQGINLTAADTVILFDSDWNPMMDLQAQDRAHRIGQKKPVVVFRFATGGTVEERLLERAEGKRRLERLVMMKGKFGGMVSEEGEEGEEGEGDAKRWGEKDLERILMKEGSEKVKVMEDGEELLEKEELEVLMDRSKEAYERAERGEERSVLGKGGLKG